jgi:hypothetical protein
MVCGSALSFSTLSALSLRKTLKNGKEARKNACCWGMRVDVVYLGPWLGWQFTECCAVAFGAAPEQITLDKKFISILDRIKKWFLCRCFLSENHVVYIDILFLLRCGTVNSLEIV